MDTRNVTAFHSVKLCNKAKTFKDVCIKGVKKVFATVRKFIDGINYRLTDNLRLMFDLRFCCGKGFFSISFHLPTANTCPDRSASKVFLLLSAQQC
jgi:hypothetical protein